MNKFSNTNFPWLLRATVRQGKYNSSLVLCEQQLCHANLLYRSKCHVNLNLPNDLYMSAINKVWHPTSTRTSGISFSHRCATYRTNLGHLPDHVCCFHHGLRHWHLRKLASSSWPFCKCEYILPPKALISLNANPVSSNVHSCFDLM